MDYLKSYGSLGIAVATVVVSLVTQWAVFGVRLNAVEARQDRQGDAISDIRGDITDQGKDVATIKADVSTVKDDVKYIRGRIDSIK